MRDSLLRLVALGLSLAACAQTGAPPPPAHPELASAHVAPTTATAQAPLVYHVPVEGLPALGEPTALVTIVAFTDYECSYCRQAEATIAHLRARYGRDLRVVVAAHPMPKHPNARPAALAALAAADQGHFEGMHTRLFAGELDEGSIAHAASAEGLQPSRFAADRMGSAVAALGRAEQIGKELGVPGTPAFFINGRMIVGPQPIGTFESVIEERLTAARKLLAAGVAPQDVYTKTIADGLRHVDEAC
jgi:protein-disulfide isomerase